MQISKYPAFAKYCAIEAEETVILLIPIFLAISATSINCAVFICGRKPSRYLSAFCFIDRRLRSKMDLLMSKVGESICILSIFVMIKIQKNA